MLLELQGRDEALIGRVLDAAVGARSHPARSPMRRPSATAWTACVRASRRRWRRKGMSMAANSKSGRPRWSWPSSATPTPARPR
ncbi:MAG: hypothetical protein U1E35_03080 [Rhodospirillales bacterium]